MIALILNSGLGHRMGVLTSEHPKCMTEISSKDTILSRQLKLLAAAGIDEVIMTTGYFDDVLVNYCKSLELPLKYTFVNNPLYSQTNYIYSIYCAREYIKDEDINNLDIILCGYHKLIVPSSPRAFFSFYLANQLPYHNKSDLRRGKNTEAYIKAINRYPIDIIVHPKYGIEIDVVELAKECKKLGVYMELNGKRISMTEDEVLAAAETGVGFIADSDAHKPERIGDMSIPMQWIDKLKLNPEQIVNLEKIPVFRSRKAKGL